MAHCYNFTLSFITLFFICCRRVLVIGILSALLVGSIAQITVTVLICLFLQALYRRFVPYKYLYDNILSEVGLLQVINDYGNIPPVFKSI